jgi:hypothetical protein
MCQHAGATLTRRTTTRFAENAVLQVDAGNRTKHLGIFRIIRQGDLAEVEARAGRSRGPISSRDICDGTEHSLCGLDATPYSDSNRMDPGLFDGLPATTGIASEERGGAEGIAEP